MAGAALALLAAALLHGSAPAASAQSQRAPAQERRCDAPSWVAAWALPVNDAAEGYERQTLRIVSEPNFGGSKVRVRLSNALGDAPVELTDVHVGTSDGGPGVVPGSDVPLTFDGRRSVTLPAGGSVLSDPADFRTRAFRPIAVSFYAPAATGPATGHNALAGTFVASGNRASDPSGAGFGAARSGARFLTAVDVLAPNDGVLVAFGDSITEGFSRERIAWDEAAPYTDTLARRLHEHAAGGGPRLSVVNLGISGNEVLEDGTGPSAVRRLERDVLAQAGLAGVLMMEGINDLTVLDGDPTPPTVRQLAAGYADIVDRVRARGAEIWLSPLTPAGDTARTTPFGHSVTPEHVARRHEANRWIRGRSGAYDGRVDFETVVLDPQFPNWIKPAYDTGDNLHPNNAGLAAMGESVDLSLFDRFRCGSAG